MEIFWLEQTVRDAPPGQEWLSGRELTRLEEFHVPKRRDDWRLGRWTAKCAVARYWNLPLGEDVLAAIELRPAPSGAPQLFLYNRPESLALSLSHSHGTALCVIAPAGVTVGCDLEKSEPRSPEFLDDYFTDEEQRLAARAPAGERDRLLTLLWSAKESALKALGCGLCIDTRLVTTRLVAAAPDGCLQSRAVEWRDVIVVHSGGRTFHGWWREVHDLVYTMVADPRPLRPVALAR